IAVVAHSRFPIVEPFAGGLEMITHLLVRELVRRGHDVDLYAHPDSDPALPIAPMRTDGEILETFGAGDVADSGMDSHAFAQTVIYHDVMARVLEGGYDIVHNHSLHHVPIAAGNALGARFVTSVHSLAEAYLRLGFGALPVVRQTVTTVSEHQRSHLEGIVGIDRTVYNGIDLEAWTANVASPGDAYFWMGRMCAEKAPHHAIEAALRSGARLHLAGPVSDADYVAEHVTPNLGHDRIEYLGHLRHDEIAPRLRDARGYVFTSVWEEPYGLTMAEALACGTPVVAYRVGAAPEIVTPDVGVLVPPGDVAALAEAMGRASSIDRRACRRRAEAFCSSTVMTESYLSLYRELSEPASR
ncbi:glycosyltransferase, partial [Rubrivirga sp.]|uniref:glycosyltransferase n=1 Tax=Rubrivirga sp. TaxID=1885344 RepID=UPI003C70986A